MGGGYWEVSGDLECDAENIQSLCGFCITPENR